MPCSGLLEVSMPEPIKRIGKVSLVGAGPGAPGLLTVRATELLATADACVYDKLANYAFLSYLRSDAELYDVGKQASNHLLPQDRINALLVDLARQGKQVVRLKGGDPFVFGRGGEEAVELVTNGIPFEIVSGVTSSIAVPAAAGIPVTHRDHCTSFHVITGHERAERNESALDFEAYAQLRGTLVFMMGVSNLAHIAHELIAHGKSPETPAAVVSQGCTARQRQVIGTLADITHKVSEASLEAPAVIVIGQVVDLAETLVQTGIVQPLRGRRILVTRTRKQAGRLSAKLRAQGAEALEIPLIRVEPNTDISVWNELLQELPGMDWLVFTSENGVDIVFDQMQTRRMDVRDLAGIKLAAVGKATADRLLEHGLVADIVPDSFTVNALTESLLGQVESGECVALARAAIGDRQIAERLRAFGVNVLEAPVYRTLPEIRLRPILLEVLAQGDLDWITFASSSTVDSFVDALDGDVSKLKGVRVASIGPVTTRTAVALGLSVDVEAKTHTLDGLVDAILQFEYEVNL